MRLTSIIKVFGVLTCLFLSEALAQVNPPPIRARRVYTDTVGVNAGTNVLFNNTATPTTASGFSLGSSTVPWLAGFLDTMRASSKAVIGSLTAAGDSALTLYNGTNYLGLHARGGLFEGRVVVGGGGLITTDGQPASMAVNLSGNHLRVWFVNDGDYYSQLSLRNSLGDWSMINTSSLVAGAFTIEHGVQEYFTIDTTGRVGIGLDTDGDGINHTIIDSALTVELGGNFRRGLKVGANASIGGTLGVTGTFSSAAATISGGASSSTLSSSNSNGLIVQQTNASNAQALQLYNSASIAPNANIGLYFQATPIKRIFGNFLVSVTDTTTGSEDADLLIQLQQAGTRATRLTLSPVSGLNIGTLALTSGAITTTGTFALNAAGGLTTNQATFPLANTTATTVNFAGAATAVTIGAATGTTTVNNALTVTGNLTVSGTGLSSFAGYIQADSVKTEKVTFLGNVPPEAKGEVYWDSTQRTFKGWQYVVLRSFAMNHNILVDSQYVALTTSETNLDTVVMGPNYPAVGKMVETKWHGSYNATGGGAKTFIFRIRKDAASVDSVTVTTAAGGSTSEPVSIVHQLLFKTIGTTARVHSSFTVTSENGVKINSNYATVNTTNSQLYILSVQISDAAAGNNFQLETGYTTTIN